MKNLLHTLKRETSLSELVQPCGRLSKVSTRRKLKKLAKGQKRNKKQKEIGTIEKKVNFTLFDKSLGK